MQGIANISLGELKTAGAGGVGALSVAGAPATEGASLAGILVAGYGAISSQGQVISGAGQVYSAISGDFKEEEK